MAAEIKTKPYCIEIETLHAHMVVEADTWDDLMGLLTKAADIPQTTGLTEREMLFKEALNAYEMSFDYSNRTRSPLMMTDLKHDLVACYLESMPLKETVEWLKENRNIATSKSAVQRLWANFKHCGMGETRRKYSLLKEILEKK